MNNLRTRVISWIRVRSGTFWFTVAVVAILSIGAGLSASYWGQLSGPTGDKESLSTTVRNIMLMMGALLALPLAYWRGLVAERQVKATSNSVGAAHEAISNQRFQAAAQMLGHELSAVRLGAIHTLGQLARENRERYYIHAVRLLASFIRQPRTGEETDTTHVSRGTGRSVREDVGAALDYIGSRTPVEVAFERSQSFTIDLQGKNFEHWDLSNLNLTGVSLKGSSFHKATLMCTDLTGADVSDCNFHGAFVGGALMKNMKVSSANFTRWYLDRDDSYSEWSDHDGGPGPVVGLTQAQLDEALNDEKSPPRLREVRDAETGEPLTWHGQSPR